MPERSTGGSASVAMAQGTVQWTLGPGWSAREIATLVQRAQGPSTELVKSSMARTVTFVPWAEGRRVVLKHYKCRGLRDVIKAAISGSKARYEWHMAHRFLDAGIPTAKPLAFGERRRAGIAIESWLATEEISGCVTLRALCSGQDDASRMSHALRLSLVQHLGTILATLHGSRIQHTDLHAGNFLVQLTEHDAALYLLDLHAARLRPWKLSRRQVVQNLAMVLASTTFPGVRPLDRLRVLRHYCRAGLWPWHLYKRLCALVDAKADALRARRIKSRSRRCIVESTQFCSHRDDGCRTYRRRDFSPEAVETAIREHEQSCAAGPGAALKIDVKTRVSLVQAPSECGPRTVCVKEYRGQPLARNMRNFFRPRPAMRSWCAAHALSVRGIDVAAPLAARVPCNPLSYRSCYVISAALEDAVGLDRYVSANLEGPQALCRRRAFAAAVGRHFRALHDKGVYHRDLKASNILVAERAPDDWAFYVVDLDRVRFMARVDRRRRVRNLSQINASTPLVLSRTDRLRFYAAYSGTGLRAERDKAFARDVIDQTRQRHCLWEI